MRESFGALLLLRSGKTAKRRRNRGDGCSLQAVATQADGNKGRN